MDFQTESVAGAVDKCLIQTILAENTAGGGVYIPGGNTGSHRVHSSQLGFQDGFVKIARFGAGFAEVDAASHIAGITASKCAHIY